MRAIMFSAAVCIASALILVGCEAAKESSALPAATCGTTWTSVDSYGNLKKYQTRLLSSGSCVTESISPTRWEQTSFNLSKNQVTCSPVPTFPATTLISANNFYSYRDGLVFLDLEPISGVYRRLVLGEDQNGKPSFTRLRGWFFERAGQILLDTDVATTASTQYTDLWEIFSYTISGVNLQLIRFDDSADWDYRECSGFKMPWQFCSKIRNGNLVYFPALTAAEKASLLDEAILIRKFYSYATITKAEFENQWSSIEKTRIEKVKEDFVFDAIQNVDTPLFVDASWKGFLKREIPSMPDLSSSRALPICYQGSRSVILTDGSRGKIYGEICTNSDGTFSFTQQ